MYDEYLRRLLRQNQPADDSTDAQPVAENRLTDLVVQLAVVLDDGDARQLESFLASHPQEADLLRKMLPTMRSLDGSVRENDQEAGPFAPTPDGHAPQRKTLGDFSLLREIGRGGMGVVYAAEQMSLHREVALKTLPLAAMIDPRQLQRFKNEVRAVAALDHPNIVSIYSVGEERGVHYYAMQKIDGTESVASY